MSKIEYLYYYSAIILITVLLMVVMLVVVRKAELADQKVKSAFDIAFYLIMILALAEWLGVVLNYAPPKTRMIHALVKAVEFSLSPILICQWICILFSSERRWRFIWPVMGINVVLECISVFTGFIFYIDAANIYHRGDYYWIYILFYMIAIVLLLISTIYYSREYQNRNLISLISTLVFLLLGVGLQIVKSEIRVCWLIGGIVSVLIYNYYSELTVQMDGLTKLLNRSCYERCIRALNYKTAILMFDVDDFKSVNDNYGHVYGDMILCKIAQCIRKTYGKSGLCFRIGGDEFCVILKKRKLDEILRADDTLSVPAEYRINMPQPSARLRMLNIRFDRILTEERKLDPLLPEVSLGYAIFDAGDQVDRVVALADEVMYLKKRRRKDTNRSLAVK